jgi:DNA-directed RNA polymerase specialized sigma24 family protein
MAWRHKGKIAFNLYLSVFLDEIEPYLKRCAANTTHISSDQEELVSEYIRRITRYLPNYAKARGSPMGYIRTIIHSANKRYIANRYKQPKKVETAHTYHNKSEEYRDVRVMYFGLIDDITSIIGEDRVEDILDGKSVEITSEEREMVSKML